MAEAELEADVRATRCACSSTPLRAIRRRAALALPVRQVREHFLDTASQPETLPAWLTEAGHRLLRQGVRAHRVPRRLELVSQHRSPLGADAVLTSARKCTSRRCSSPARRRRSIAMRRAAFDASGSSGAQTCGRRSCCQAAGHWIQQERPAEVNQLLLEFLAGR